MAADPSGRSLNWVAAQAAYVRSPLFESYGAFVETRPVSIDCSLGVNPLGRLYDAPTVTLPAAAYARYPSGGAHGIAALAGYVACRWPAVPPESLCFGAGSQGAISSLSRILGGSGVKVLGFTPQFIPALLEFATVGARVETLALAPSDVAGSVEALGAALTGETTAIYLDNPNNPTGYAVPLSALDRLARVCEARGALLIVDEAYGDFIGDDQSALNLPQRNVIVVRSFSKGCGLAGLRLGYIVIRDPALRRCYQALGLHFSASAAAGDIAATLLPTLDLPAMRRRIAALKAQMTAFIAAYPAFQVAPTDPATPIFLLRWLPGDDLRTGGRADAQSGARPSLYDALMDVGIQTEPGHFFGLADPGLVRCRIPAPQEFETFCTLWRRRFQGTATA